MPDRRPNLLLVFGDQHRAGMTGVEGNPQAITPAIDALARGGALLTHAIANAPVCCPSRGTMLTGTYPTTHRVLSNDLPIRTDLPTFATVARDVGYRTGYVGKWHLDGVPRRKFTPPGPRRLGFDDYWAAYNCSHNYYDTKYYRDTSELIRDDRYEPTVQTDLAIDFLNQDDPRPFCLTLSWGPPHDPYPQVPEHYRAMFDPAALRLSSNVQEPTDNPLARNLNCRRTIADYYAAVTALDAELARLLGALEKAGYADNTVVVFTSDHGDMLWSHGLMKKQSPYDESIRVPLIVRGPGVTAGTRSATPFGLIDLMPTMLGLIDLPVPAGVEGRDRSAAVRTSNATADVEADADVLILNQHACDEAAVQGMPEWRGLRTPAHTYVETSPGHCWLLFDNTADPQQMRNLAGDPAHAALRETLSATLRTKLNNTNDPFLPGEQLLAHFGLTEAWADREARINH